jgi:hypothetical protein
MVGLLDGEPSLDGDFGMAAAKNAAGMPASVSAYAARQTKRRQTKQHQHKSETAAGNKRPSGRTVAPQSHGGGDPRESEQQENGAGRFVKNLAGSAP